MIRTKLGALAAVVVTSTMVLGATTAPATAAKGAAKGAAKAAVKGKPARSPKVTPLAAQKRVVAKRIASTDTALQRQAQRVSASGVLEAPAVLANIAEDRRVLAGYVTDLETASTLTEVQAVSALVGSVRPEVYSLVVNGLRQAAHAVVAAVAADLEVQELTGLADTREGEGNDVTVVRTLLAAAATGAAQVPTLGASVVDAGTVLTARSSVNERVAFAAEVDALEALLEEIETSLTSAAELLDAMAPVSDPATDPGV